MLISSIEPERLASWAAFHESLLEFIHSYGQKGISPAEFKKIHRLTPRLLERPGTAIMMATVMAEDGRRTAGVLCSADYGRDLCAAVVHPLYRRRGVGSSLLKAQLEAWRRFECSVAANNVPGLKMCFNAGLSAFDARISRAGKPELLLSRKLPPKEGEYFAAARAGDSYAVHE